MSRYPRKHLIALVTALLLWGFSFPALKIALRTNSALAILFYRYLFSLLLILPWAVHSIRRHKIDFRGHSRFLWLGLFNFAGSWLQFQGLKYTTAIKSAILTQLMVVVVPILAFFILAEKLDRSKAFALFLSLVGAVLISTELNWREAFTGGTVKGDLLTVAAILFWALFIVYTRRWANRAGVLPLLLGNYLGVQVLSTAAMTATGSFRIDSPGIWLALILAVISTILPTALYNFSLREIDANASTIIGPLEVVSGALLSMILLHERLSLIGLLGALLVLGSIYLVNRTPNRSGEIQKKHV